MTANGSACPVSRGDFWCVSGEPPKGGPVRLLVHRGSLVHENDALGRWRTVSEGTVRSDGVVVSPPLLDDDLSLPERLEDLAIEKFIPEAGIEAFAVSTLPGRARFDDLRRCGESALRDPAPSARVPNGARSRKPPCQSGKTAKS
jgi:hypothetical protein